MALISCPECGKEISDKANTCIHCGYPLEINILEASGKSSVIANIGDNELCASTDDLDLNALMKDTDYNKGKAIIKLKKITGLTIEECRAKLNKPFEEYIYKNIDLEGIMQQAEHNKAKSVELLRIKTGLSLIECTKIFDELYKDLDNKDTMLNRSTPTYTPSVKSDESKRICNSCHAIFVSSSSTCPSCGSSNTKNWKQLTTSNSNTVICPRCGSTQIQLVQRKWRLTTGFLTNKVDRVCMNCKHKF